MNVFIYAIWVFAIIFFTLSFIESAKTQKTYSDVKKRNGYTPKPQCEFSLVNLQRLSDNSQCCIQNGSQNGKILFREPTTSLLFQIQDVPTFYMNVCRGACDQGLTPNGTCVNGLGQSRLDSCVALLEPEDCIAPAKPIARRGNQFYYAAEFSSSGCEFTENCDFSV